MVSLQNYKRSPFPALPESHIRWLEEELRKIERVTEDNNEVLANAGIAYTLPPATITTLGGIKVGSNLTITSDGTLSANATPYTLPTASAITLGGVKVGANLSIDGNGVLSGHPAYTLPTASSTVLGGVKVGSGLSISGAGVLSANSGAIVSVKDYGAKGDGTTDDSAAFNAALAVNTTVFVPEGVYRLASRVTVGQLDRQTLYGENSTSTILRSSSQTEPVIYVNAGVPGVSIRSMTIDRSVTPTTGVGIDYNRIGEGVLDDLLVQNHLVGIRLGEAGYSRLTNSTIWKNLSHGVVMASTNTGQLQWSLFNCLLTQNGGSGLIATTQNSTTATTSLGEWLKVSTFANSGYGMALLGKPGSGLYGVRISECFVGADGNSELYLDSYGSMHKIDSNFFELAGQGPTGPTLSNFNSNVGYGIHATANNDTILVSGNYVSGPSYSCIDLSASNSLVSGNYVENGGIALVTGERVGIRIRQGNALVTNNISRNGAGTIYQQYGFYNDTDTVTYSGNLGLLNTVANFGGASAVNTNSIANGGSTRNNILADLHYNGVKVLGARNTGWAPMSGTLNTSTSYNTGTITLLQLAQRVGAIQAALTNHGLIGP